MNVATKLRSIKTGSPEFFLIAAVMAAAFGFLVSIVAFCGLPSYFIWILASVWAAGGMAMDYVETSP